MSHYLCKYFKEECIMSTIDENWNIVDVTRAFCQKVLPLVYDESLSYLEMVCKMSSKLNEVIENNNNLPQYVKDLIKETVNSDEFTQIVGSVLMNTIINVKFPPEGITPAKGDGVTDDTKSIQDCLDYANAQGGSVVFFPSGKYLTSTLSIAGKTSILGADRYNTTLFLKGGGSTPLLQGVINQSVRNIALDGNRLNQIEENYLIDGDIENALIDNVILEDSAHCITSEKCNNNEFCNVKVLDIGDSVFIDAIGNNNLLNNINTDYSIIITGDYNNWQSPQQTKIDSVEPLIYGTLSKNSIYNLNNVVAQDYDFKQYNLLVCDENIENVGLCNVCLYGAKGDGETDNTTILQNLINKFSNIYIPAGNYKTNSLKLRSGIKIFGEGKLVGTGTNIFNMFAISPEDEYKNITIDGLSFENNTDNGSAIILGVNNLTTLNCDNIKISDCKFNSIARRAVDAYCPTSTAISTKLFVINCEITNIGNVGLCNSGVTPYIEGCIIDNTGSENITIDNYCYNAVIKNCFLSNAIAGYGTIGCGLGGDGLLIDGNTIIGGGLPCIAIGDNQEVRTNPYYNIRICNNKVSGGTIGLLINCGTFCYANITNNDFNLSTQLPVNFTGQIKGVINFLGNFCNPITEGHKLYLLKYLTSHDLNINLNPANYINTGYTLNNSLSSFMRYNGRTIKVSLYFSKTEEKADGDIPFTIPVPAFATPNADIQEKSNGLVSANLRANGDIQVYGSGYTSAQNFVLTATFTV